MRLSGVLGLTLAVAAVAALVTAGGLDGAARWALGMQRSLTAALAGAVTALRQGEPGALAALMLAAATYGVAHAAGPGHGKALLAAAAAGTATGPWRLAGIAVAGSLAQGLTAVLVTAGGLALLDIGATRLMANAERMTAPIGFAALGLVGGWLVLRGVRALRQPEAVACCGHDHHHHHDHAPIGTSGTFALIGAIAARPCGGAILTLAVAWGAGVAMAGVLAVGAMALGTALVTAASALAAHGLREAALAGAGARRLGTVAAVLQIGAGLAAAGIAVAGMDL